MCSRSRNLRAIRRTTLCGNNERKRHSKATGSRVLMDLIAAVEQDIYYASWYGIKKAF